MWTLIPQLHTETAVVLDELVPPSADIQHRKEPAVWQALYLVILINFINNPH